MIAYPQQPIRFIKCNFMSIEMEHIVQLKENERQLAIQVQMNSLREQEIKILKEALTGKETEIKEMLARKTAETQVD